MCPNVPQHTPLALAEMRSGHYFTFDVALEIRKLSYTDQTIVHHGAWGLGGRGPRGPRGRAAFRLDRHAIAAGEVAVPTWFKFGSRPPSLRCGRSGQRAHLYCVHTFARPDKSRGHGGRWCTPTAGPVLTLASLAGVRLAPLTFHSQIQLNPADYNYYAGARWPRRIPTPCADSRGSESPSRT